MHLFLSHGRTRSGRPVHDLCSCCSYCVCNIHYKNTIICPDTGVEIVGIYRISGKTNDILRIKKQFDNGTVGCSSMLIIVFTVYDCH